MLCSHCHKNEAEVFFKQLVNNQLTQLVLCRPCAAEHGLTASAPNLILQLLSGLGAVLPQGPERATARQQCPACGLRYGRFMESGRLGCPECYKAFRRPLADLLQRIHGAVRHAGSRPAGAFDAPTAPGKASRAAPAPGELRARLKAAVAREDFEEAARLRDRIRRLEAPE